MQNDGRNLVGLYIRVSTTGQVTDGYGLEAQKKALEAHCAYKGYTIFKTYCDAGVSGKDTKNRKEYNKMMSDMRAKKFDIILALKLDRISRSVSDFALLLDELEKHRCSMEFVNEPIDVRGIGGKMMAGILSVFAQFEREVIVERTLSGVNEAVHNGHFGGKPPLGYSSEIVNGERTKNWVINPSEAKMVREIFDLCLKGKTYAQISNIMNQKYTNIIACHKTNKETGVKEVKYRNWKDSSISVILNNKRYMGIHEHRKKSKEKETIEIVGKIPPIITETIFNECQENIEKNKRNYYRNKTYLFMQKLVCPKCGRILACNGTKKSNNVTYLYYKCKDCGTYVREELIEEALINELNNLLELNYLISNECKVVEKDLVDDFNNCRIDNRMRFAIDERIINDKLKCDGCYEFNEIWKLASHEAKCKFIYEYVDSIIIKKSSYKSNKIGRVDLIELKLRKSKLEKLFNLSNQGLIDEMLAVGEYKFSKADMKSEKDALDYINILKKKHNISFIELPLEEQNFYWDTSFFKVINIIPTKVIEKPKALYLYLDDYYLKE